MVLAPLFLLLCLLAASTNAYPTGAGSCQGGQAAVTGIAAHNDAATVEPIEPLAEAGYGLFIDDVAIDADSTTTLTVGTEALLAIRAGTADVPFKGFLMRLSSTDATVDASTLITPAFNAQEAGACATETNVGGATHTSADEKQQASARVLVSDAPVELLLEITVVEQNDATLSEAFYSSYTLMVEAGEDGGGTTTMMPTAAEGSTTTMMPTAADGGDGNETTTMEPTMDDSGNNETTTMEPTMDSGMTMAPTMEGMTMEPTVTTTTAPPPSPNPTSIAPPVQQYVAATAFALIGLIVVL